MRPVTGPRLLAAPRLPDLGDRQHQPHQVHLQGNRQFLIDLLQVPVNGTFREPRAVGIVREELVLFLLNVALILIFLSAVGIYYFEHDRQPEHFASVFHSLWWAVVTLTTVGYGDMFPITTGGRVFTFFVLFLGLGIVAVPTGLFASALAKAREEEEDGVALTDQSNREH